ncbi:Tubulin cofactor C domain-containing protein 1 [Novymonas esmeraldas]|uniref:Tubulin cofactor C domain-containing protein 1 n=1 Tax=Novymonas esmeraldas TaxID=1808958 RepID=A0AAW0F684_9TRYP
MSRRPSGSFGRSGSGSSHLTGASSNGDAGSPTAAAGAQAVYCVNPVLFENCGALLNAPSGLTTASVLKVLQSTGSKTSISLANWKETAMTVLGLRESTAYAIFDVFFAFSGGCIQSTPAYSGGERTSVAQLRQESNRALLQKMGGTVDQGRWPAASTARQVSLPGLLVFLLCQLFVERRRAGAQSESTSEAVAEYVRQHLHDFITAVAVTRASRLTMADAAELGYLLREVVNGVEQPFGPSIGFLWQFNEKTIDVAVLSQYLRVRIRSNGEIKKGSAAAAANAFGFNNTVIHNLVNTVHITSYTLLPDMASRLLSSNLTISNCSQTHIYAPSALPHTQLSTLTNCTVSLGPVSGVLSVQNCHHCCISALCGAIIVSQCTNVTLYVCVNTPPVLLAGDGKGKANGPAAPSPAGSGVRFAPYNSFYPAMEQHISSSGISPLLNVWNVGLPDHDSILPPSEFQSMPFPLTQSANLSNVTRTNPCPLPAPYRDAMNRRLQRLREVNESITDAAGRLREAGRTDLVDELHQRITVLFRDWLKETGQEHVLADLTHTTAPNKAAV